MLSKRYLYHYLSFSIDLFLSVLSIHLKWYNFYPSGVILPVTTETVFKHDVWLYWIVPKTTSSTSLKFLKNKLVWSILLLHILFSHCLYWHSFQSCFQVMKLCNYFYSWWNYDSSNLLNFLSLSRGHFWCYHCLGNCLPVIFWHHVIQRPATMFRCI